MAKALKRIDMASVVFFIGSAAGVAAMGLEKIEFFWYARKIGPLALAGYFAGIVCYIVQYNMFH